MNLQRRITRLLHDEHIATIALLERLERLIARHRPAAAPALGDGDTFKLLGDLATNLENETGRHFGLEQDRLFPLLSGGEAFIAELLTEEHAAILPLAARLAALARAARAASSFAADGWREFHQLAGELIERQVAHIQKEEMGLLPMLDDVLDAERDDEIADAYLMSQ
jgi:hemerythrin-like domain-containing protein